MKKYKVEFKEGADSNFICVVPVLAKSKVEALKQIVNVFDVYTVLYVGRVKDD